jgi:hypothetical protein
MSRNRFDFGATVPINIAGDARILPSPEAHR